MNLTQLTDTTDWCRRNDPDAEFSVIDGALFITFCSDAETILNDAPDSTVCIDVRIDEDDSYTWIRWDEATDEQLESAEVFRYVALV